MKDFANIIKDLTVTETGVQNIPNDLEKEKLFYLYYYIVAPIQAAFDIRINSGFRNDLVNRIIGGSPTSQHKKAEAIDFTPEKSPIPEVFAWCRKNLVYGQLIDEEHGDAKWIHISLVRVGGTNMQTMKYRNGVYSNV